MPWPPRMQPIAPGFSRLICAMSRPSWKPGRRHGTQATLSPKISFVSRSHSSSRAGRVYKVAVDVELLADGRECVRGHVVAILAPADFGAR